MSPVEQTRNLAKRSWAVRYSRKAPARVVGTAGGLTIAIPEPPPTPAFGGKGAEGMKKGFPISQSNPLRPRAFGGKGAEGMKKGFPISWVCPGVQPYLVADVGA